jgi:Papain-like cysteine protease AvrRpt2
MVRCQQSTLARPGNLGILACLRPSEDAPGTAVSGSIAVKLRPQQTRMWCWAASAEMVMATLGKDVAQCLQANKRFGHTDCCNSPTPGPCVQGGWPEFPKYGFSSMVTNNTALTWSQIVDQIKKKKPVAFSWHWTGGGGHMMVLWGYSQSGGKNYVSINNPWPPNVGEVQVLTYEAYVSGPGYTHWNDYYNVARVSPGEKVNEDTQPSDAGKFGDKANDGANNSNKKGKVTSVKAAVTQSRPAAINALSNLGKNEAVKNLFAPGALEKAELTVPPFPVVMVGLEDLRKEAPGADPKKLLEKDFNTVIYPISSQANIVGSITMQGTGTGWTVGSYSGGTLARLLEHARSTHAKKKNAALASSYVVSIPALNLYFVAFPGSDALELVPVQDDASLGLSSGQAVRASDIMPRLIEAAKKHNGLPS